MTVSAVRPVSPTATSDQPTIGITESSLGGGVAPASRCFSTQFLMMSLAAPLALSSILGSSIAEFAKVLALLQSPFSE